jgi:hypothetical protein
MSDKKHYVDHKSPHVGLPQSIPYTQGKAKNLVCSVKFKVPTDHEIARRFAKIPGSRLMHLHHNRHEFTWCRMGGT